MEQGTNHLRFSTPGVIRLRSIIAKTLSGQKYPEGSYYAQATNTIKFAFADKTIRQSVIASYVRHVDSIKQRVGLINY
jgi:hypothetical protein